MSTSADERIFSPVVYIRTLVRDWRIIVAGTVVATLCGVLAAVLLPVEFQSSVSLVLSPPPFKDAEGLNILMPKTLSVPDYAILLQSDGILMRAAERVNDPAIWSGDELENLRLISKLRKRMSLQSQVTEKTVQQTMFSPIVVLTARASTAAQAQDLVRAWAEVCEEVSEEVYKTGKTGVRDFIGDQFESTRAELQEVNEEIRDVEIEWNDDLAAAKIAKVHSRLLDYQEKLIDTHVKIATVSEEIRSTQEYLDKTPQFLTLWKSPPMESVFLEKNPKADKDQGYQEEVINGVYQDLESKLMLKQVELANLQEFAKQMESSIIDLEAELQQLREEIAKRAYERKMLNMQETPQLRSYDLLSTMLEQAKIVESGEVNLADLKILSPPVLPDKKSWPPRSLFVVMAAAAGLFASTALVLAREMLRSIG